jgi:translocator protein
MIPFIAAAIGGLATQRSVDSRWYRTLRKPSWNPPTWLFGPVWTGLYLLMGVASWLVWQKGEETHSNCNEPVVGTDGSKNRSARIRNALTWYGVQLVANALWPLLFFGVRRIRLALGELIVLWTLIGGAALQFYRIRPIAGGLMLPYFAWTSFAAILNATIWRLNRNRS